MRSTSLLLIAVAMALLAPAASAHDRDRDFDLPQAGVYIEGIGVDERAGVFYVSATNQSGTIYRGRTSRATRPRGLAAADARQRRPRDRGRPRRPRVRRRRPGRRGPRVRPPRRAARRTADRRSRVLPQRRLDRPGRGRVRHRLVAAGDLARVPPLRALAHRPLPRRLADDHLHAAADRLRPRRDHDHPQAGTCSTTQGTTGQLWRIDLWTRRDQRGRPRRGAPPQRRRDRAARPHALRRAELRAADLQAASSASTSSAGAPRTGAADARPIARSPPPSPSGARCSRSIPSSASRRPPRWPRTGSWQSTRSEERPGRGRVIDVGGGGEGAGGVARGGPRGATSPVASTAFFRTGLRALAEFGGPACGGCWPAFVTPNSGSVLADPARAGR